MRYSKEHKQQTRGRILQQATQAFREEGLRGVGVTELMSKLGLTHGGFYAHFKNKEALVVEACTYGLSEAVEKLESGAAEAPVGEEVRKMIEAYLSDEHRDNPGQGCVVAALAGELCREPSPVRRTFTRGLRAYIDRLATLLPFHVRRSREEQALILLAGMVGCLLLARAVDNRAESDEILRVGREFYLEAFTRKASEQ
ncbi:MAG: TetR/AcrR family transcriptional regulator [Hassallia sp. WJT32-NPBG1]|jgi:TetR/AcrR family transcriptional repressor of nem operon|nr:TetR/AcrR family transcriptional regulator [Hassallia sp. WJT32-NPBG1]